LSFCVSFRPADIQVNKRELVSIEIINEVQYDIVSVKRELAPLMPQEITLSRAYKDQVAKRMFFA